MKKKKLGVDEYDIMAEIDALRPTMSSYKRRYTKEQDEALWQARKAPGKKAVKWSDLHEWWVAKWGHINIDTMRRRLRELEKEREQ